MVRGLRRRRGSGLGVGLAHSVGGEPDDIPRSPRQRRNGEEYSGSAAAPGFLGRFGRGKPVLECCGCLLKPSLARYGQPQPIVGCSWVMERAWRAKRTRRRDRSKIERVLQYLKLVRPLARPRGRPDVASKPDQTGAHPEVGDKLSYGLKIGTERFLRS